MLVAFGGSKGYSDLSPRPVTSPGDQLAAIEGASRGLPNVTGLLPGLAHVLDVRGGGWASRVDC